MGEWNFNENESAAVSRVSRVTAASELFEKRGCT